MYCSQCGHPVEGYFCVNCGSPTANVPVNNYYISCTNTKPILLQRDAKAKFKRDKSCGVLKADFSHKLWKKSGLIGSKIYRFSDIISCELIDDGSTIYQTSTSSLVGRAAVGGIIFGPFGAVLGGMTARKTPSACKNLYINIVVNDPKEPIVKISFISPSTSSKRDTYYFKFSYKQAQKTLALLKIMSENQ